MLKAWFEISLWKRVLGALLVGIVVGSIWGEGAGSIQFIGTLFVDLIRMLIIPLIFTTIVAGMVSMGDPKRMGSIGLKAILLFMATTFFAIVIGLTLATIFEPGSYVDKDAIFSAEAKSLGGPPEGLLERLLGIVPKNPLEAMVKTNVLSTIFFAVFLGAGIVATGEKGRLLGEVMQSASEVVLKMAHLIMELAPFGVFALIAAVVGTKGAATLAAILPLVLVVYGGCLVHIGLVYGGVIRLVAGLSPAAFFRGAIDAQLVAYSTSSSAATLPVSLAVAEENLGVKPVVSGSVLPLGATINMDGTALYVGVMALFSAQVFDISLDFGDYFIIALSTTLASIGAASVPSASLFLLAAVLAPIGVSDQQAALVVGFMVAFDRILDMMRTAVNVTGDLTVATTVGRLEGEFDEEVFRARPEV